MLVLAGSRGGKRKVLHTSINERGEEVTEEVFEDVQGQDQPTASAGEGGGEPQGPDQTTASAGREGAAGPAHAIQLGPDSCECVMSHH